MVIRYRTREMIAKVIAKVNNFTLLFYLPSQTERWNMYYSTYPCNNKHLNQMKNTKTAASVE